MMLAPGSRWCIRGSRRDSKTRGSFVYYGRCICVETLSVMLQVTYYKYTKKDLVKGNECKMAPLTTFRGNRLEGNSGSSAFLDYNYDSRLNRIGDIENKIRNL